MKVSVLINNYNYGKFVGQAIESVLNQTYNSIEIILYDDGSTDESLSVVNKYKDLVKIIARPNFGKGHVWNQVNAVYEAFKECTGDVICLLDSDDYFFESKVKEVVAVFEQHSNVTLVQHRFQLYDDYGRKMNAEKRPIFSGVDILRAIRFTNRLDFFFTQTSGLSFSRKFLEKVLPIQEDELNLLCVDLRLARMAAMEGSVITLQNKLAAYRIHTTNWSAQLRSDDFFKKYNAQHEVFYERLCRQHNQPPIVGNKGSINYIKVLLLLIVVDMSFIEKWNFITAWYKSYKN